VAIVEHEALVLRTIKYGDNGLIVHLFSRSNGRINAMARGALRAKNRYDARIEPFAKLRLQLSHGRSDLAQLRSADRITLWDNIRSNWRLQSRAAAIMDCVSRLSVPEDESEHMFHLLSNILEFLDRSDPDSRAADAIAIAGVLKLLHLAGLAPVLTTCARGSDDTDLTGWSAVDGGVVGGCAMEPGDLTLRASQLEAARWCMATSLAVISATAVELPDPADMRWVEQVAIRSIAAHHAGFQPRPLTA
jgi:DNA repair protein RecO (recombination protein O)